MAVSNAQILKGNYDVTKSMGDKVVSSDFAFVVEGFEELWMITKQAPWGMLSAAGEIEVPTPMGAAMWQSQQLKVNQQGSITLMETVAGHIDDGLRKILTNSSGSFNATVYEGTPERYIRSQFYEDCFLVLENPDRDWENRSQIMTLTGTLFFHYFGEGDKGNSKDYR